MDKENINHAIPLVSFELGRYYKHTSGETMYICAYAGTNYYGVTMLAETGKGKFKPVGTGPTHCVNWIEIDEEEFTKPLY